MKFGPFANVWTPEAPRPHQQPMGFNQMLGPREAHLLRRAGEGRGSSAVAAQARLASRVGRSHSGHGHGRVSKSQPAWDRSRAHCVLFPRGCRSSCGSVERPGPCWSRGRPRRRVPRRHDRLARMEGPTIPSRPHPTEHRSIWTDGQGGSDPIPAERLRVYRRRMEQGSGEPLHNLGGWRECEVCCGAWDDPSGGLGHPGTGQDHSTAHILDRLLVSPARWPLRLRFVPLMLRAYSPS